MPNILIIGATRGLGAALANLYASHPNTTVYGTTRSLESPKGHHGKIVWVKGIDVSEEGAGNALANQLGALGLGGGMVEGGVRGLDVVVCACFLFEGCSVLGKERRGERGGWSANGDRLLLRGILLRRIGRMARSGRRRLRCIVRLSSLSSLLSCLLTAISATSAISPPFLIHALSRAHYLPRGSKILLVSSESGSITLRHEKEGGGNYAHHASKTALNMVGKLLSLDLKDEGVIVSIVHPGFMRTEMTRGVGFDKFWDDGGGELMFLILFFFVWAGLGRRR
jgi:NAD(P)-dependent dehydrogenase (short-subunit alcohol dehydrogenase family)